MNDTVITLQGYVGGDVKVRSAGDGRVATFRVACTPRRWSRRDDEWVDGQTQWYSVNCWRALGEHVALSLRRGDAVVVHGRLRSTSWTSSAGAEMSAFDVDAAFVGHDLNRGTSAFAKAARAPAAGETAGVEEGAPSGAAA